MVEVGPLHCVGILRHGHVFLLHEKLVLPLLAEIQLGSLEDACPVIRQDERALFGTLFQFLRLAQTCLMLGKHELVVTISLGCRCNVVVLSLLLLLRVQTVTRLVDHLSSS